MESSSKEYVAAYYAMHGYFLLTICYMLHATCYLLLTINYYFTTTLRLTLKALSATCYVLCATCYMLHATCYLLLATCYLLLATCYLQPRRTLRLTLKAVPLWKRWRWQMMSRSERRYRTYGRRTPHCSEARPARSETHLISTLACNRRWQGLQPWVAGAATVGGRGCNRRWQGLQP